MLNKSRKTYFSFGEGVVVGGVTGQTLVPSALWPPVLPCSHPLTAPCVLETSDGRNHRVMGPSPFISRVRNYPVPRICIWGGNPTCFFGQALPLNPHPGCSCCPTPKDGGEIQLLQGEGRLMEVTGRDLGWTSPPASQPVTSSWKPRPILGAFTQLPEPPASDLWKEPLWGWFCL